VVTQSKIGLESAATLPARLPLGMRATSIAIDNVKGVAGLVSPGDHVDVVAVPPRSGDETPRGVAILRDVLVLAMGPDVQPATAAAPGPLSSPPAVLTTVTLALTPNQVDLISGADMNTSLRLALRNPKEAAGAFAPEVLRLAAQGSGPATATAPAVAAATTAPQADAAPAAASGVIVIDGDHVGSGATAAP
jgi:pilus assembly protein CpaB